MKNWNIDSTWSLFLDRDGVINTRKIGGYIQSVDEFEFLPGACSAIAELSHLFKYVFVVTNQQGIGKGLMTEGNLSDIHRYMAKQVEMSGGKITHCYHAPDLHHDTNLLRKPNTGMGLLAKKHYPDIDFHRSVMVGDSDTDIEFGIKLGMKTVRISTSKELAVPADLTVQSLEELKNRIKAEIL